MKKQYIKPVIAVATLDTLPILNGSVDKTTDSTGTVSNPKDVTSDDVAQGSILSKGSNGGWDDSDW